MKNQVKETSVTEAIKEIKNGILFIDVREPHELVELSFDVSGIINIPLSIFEKRMGEIPKDKNVLLVCRRGRRSMRASELLVKNGFTKVTNMKGGIVEWVNNNLAVKNEINK